MKLKGIDFTWTGHCSFILTFEKFVIGVNPKFIDISFPMTHVLLTGSSPDLCSLSDLQKVVEPKTLIIGPSEVFSVIKDLDFFEFHDSSVPKDFGFGYFPEFLLVLGSVKVYFGSSIVDCDILVSANPELANKIKPTIVIPWGYGSFSDLDLEEFKNKISSEVIVLERE